MNMGRTLQDVLIIGYFVCATWSNLRTQPFVEKLDSESLMTGCSQNLKVLGAAVLEYKRQNGVYPKRFGELFPKYVNERHFFVCPAAQTRIAVRTGQHGYAVYLGTSRITSTYMLLYKSPRHEAVLAERGPETPIIECKEHILRTLDRTRGSIYRPFEDYQQLHGSPMHLIYRKKGVVDRVSFFKTFEIKHSFDSDDL